MAHELDFSLGRPAMAYVGETPWHGLGAKLESGMDQATWINEAGLNWTVHRSPVRYEDMNAEQRVLKEREVLSRSDNGAALAVVSKRYHPVQPAEVVEFFGDLVSLAGFTLETAGALAGGRRIWALAKTNYEANIAGQDLLKGYLLLATSYDGTFATTASLTDVRVVCQNTLRLSQAISERSKDGVVRVPHLRQFDAAEVKRELGVLDGQWEAHTAQVQRLTRTAVTSDTAQAYFASLFPAQDEAVKQSGIPDAVMQLFSGQGRGSELDTAKNTAWGLVNAVTEYVDHHRRSRGVGGRLDSAWFGAGSRLKQQAWDSALELVA
jgi:phage/plasmid-like protein (TIGR03299 family)